MTQNSTSSLKYISYGIYLQIFLGVGYLAIASSGIALPPMLTAPAVFGGILIALAVNSLIYIGRYKRSIR